MRTITRRHFVITAAAVPLVSACANGVNSSGGQRIDVRVDSALEFMNREVPGAQELSNNAAGVLVMPLITEASFGFGGSFGRGALRVNDITVDYYSAARATFGLQIGGQQYSHALFFMTEEALSQFRRSPGWAVGADVRYATPDQGLMLGKETTEIEPVIAMVFGQSGLIAGASVAGIKYTRIIP